MEVNPQPRSHPARVRHGKRLLSSAGQENVMDELEYIPSSITVTVTEIKVVPPSASILVSTSSTNSLSVSTSWTISSSSTSSSISPLSTSSTPSSIPLSVTAQQTTTSISGPNPSASVTTNGGNVSGAAQVTSRPAVPAGAIAGIVIGVVLIFLVGIIVAMRKQSLNKRLKLRGWATNPIPSPSFLWIDPEEKSKRTPYPKSTQTRGDPAVTSGGRYASSAVVPPLPARLLQTESNSATSSNAPSIITNSTPESAIVVSTFIPTLPDELSIAIRETIHILSEYDDRWAYCSNGRGETGMVPLECLARRGAPRGFGRHTRGSSLVFPPIQLVART